MLEKELLNRKLPELLTALDGIPITNVNEWELRREEIKKMLSKNEYGYLPPLPERLEFETVEENKLYCASKAIYKKIICKGILNGKEFSFPFVYVSPVTDGKHKAFIHINFRDAVPDRYMPTEEIIDNDFVIASFCYNDVTTDDNDFTNGLAGVIFEGGKREPTSCGKIIMWAWAAMRVMDYLSAQPEVDAKKVCVCGHSRLGKTALVTAAYDERFALAYSNDSGCSGAAISRGKVGESIEVITRVFPFWFCENYQQYKNREYEADFDQHFLLSLIAPRNLYIASAELDEWADPKSEFLCALSVAPVYKLYGLSGLITEDRYPELGEKLHDGATAYHVRRGSHYFSRTDWLMLMEYFKKL